MTGQMGPTLSLTALSPPGSEQTLVDAARRAVIKRSPSSTRAIRIASAPSSWPRCTTTAGPRTSRRRCSSPLYAGCAPASRRSPSSRGSTRSPRTPASTSSGATGARARCRWTPTKSSPPAAGACSRSLRAARRRREQAALDDLQGAFGGLSESHHRLLVMREFEGRSYNEIAASTGMSLQMVESALFRARRKLSEEYDELASGRRCEQVQAAIEDRPDAVLRSIGIRERRQLTRHLAHCQPCRREARLAGVDESLVKPRSIAARIAALLPFPLWRWPWHGGSGGPGGAGAGSRGGRADARPSLIARAGGHHLSAAQSLQSVAGAAARWLFGHARPSCRSRRRDRDCRCGGGAATLFGSEHAVGPAAVHRLAAYSSSGAAATPHRSVIGVASTAVARATTTPPVRESPSRLHAAGDAGRHGARHRATGTKAAGRRPRAEDTRRHVGTTAGTTKAPGTPERLERPGHADSTKPAATAGDEGGRAPVSRAPARVVSTVTGVTRRTVSTVGRVVQGVGSVVHGVGSVVQGAGSVVQGAGSGRAGRRQRRCRGTVGSVLPPAVSQTLSGVLPPSGSGATSGRHAIVRQSGRSLEQHDRARRRSDATARKVVGTVGGYGVGDPPLRRARDREDRASADGRGWGHAEGRDREGAHLWNTGSIGAWRSLVARTVRVGEVPGSNPGAPISEKPC